MDQAKDIEHNMKMFLELWQNQYSELAKDPKIAHGTLNMFKQMQENYLKSVANETNEDNDSPISNASVFRNADNELLKLNQRITEFEGRLAKLESGASGSGKTARRTAKKS